MVDYNGKLVNMSTCFFVNQVQCGAGLAAAVAVLWSLHSQ